MPQYIFPVSPVLCSKDPSFCKHLTHLEVTYELCSLGPVYSGITLTLK